MERRRLSRDEAATQLRAMRKAKHDEIEAYVQRSMDAMMRKFRTRVEDDEDAEIEPRGPTRAELAAGVNRLAEILAEAFQQLSQVQRFLHMPDHVERSTLPLRRMRAEERPKN